MPSGVPLVSVRSRVESLNGTEVGTLGIIRSQWPARRRLNYGAEVGDPINSRRPHDYTIQDPVLLVPSGYGGGRNLGHATH